MKEKYGFKVGDVVTFNARGYRAFSKFRDSSAGIKSNIKKRMRNLLSGVLIEKIINLNNSNVSLRRDYNYYAEISFDNIGMWLCFLKKIRSAKKIKKIKKRIIAKML